MAGKRGPRRWYRWVYLGVAFFALANSGCLLATAGVAGGAVAGYAYYKGKVSQEFNARLEDTWAATRQAVTDLGMPILNEERQGTTGVIESRTSANETVRIELDTIPSPIPAEGALTRVGVRVATFGDYPLSERLLSQVGVHLVPAPVPQPSAAAPAWGPIQTSPPSRTTLPPGPTPSPAVSPATFAPQTAEPPLLTPKPRE